MQERILGSQASGTSFGQSVLFFGCRRRDQDFLYGDLLTQWDREGKLTLFTAFSREQVSDAVIRTFTKADVACASKIWYV